MSLRPRFLRPSWIAGGATLLAAVVAVSVLLSIPVPSGRTVPEPLVAAAPTDAGTTGVGPTGMGTTGAPTASAPTLPPLDEPWYRTGLPVDGEIVPIGARTVGHVTVTRAGERLVRVTVTGFSTDLVDADIRVQLTGGDVVRAGRRAQWIPHGDPVEVGVIEHGATGAVIDVRVPQILPPEVHSLLILDWNTSTIMGGAELLPGA